VDVLRPRTLDEALRMKAERPEAVPIQGGTDVMVELNFDRGRPAALLNLNEVHDLRGWSRENGTVWLGAGLTYTEAMQPPLSELLPALAEASRTVGGPQIRNRVAGRRCDPPAARRRRVRHGGELEGRARHSFAGLPPRS